MISNSDSPVADLACINPTLLIDIIPIHTDTYGNFSSIILINERVLSLCWLILMVIFYFMEAMNGQMLKYIILRTRSEYFDHLP